MIEFAGELRDWLSIGGSLFFLLIVIIWFLLNDIYEKDNTSREGWEEFLKKRDWPDIYHRMISMVLDWLDNYLNPALKTTGGTLANKDVAVAWSSGTLGLALSLAVAYPLLILLGQWIWTGVGASVGGNVIITTEPNVWNRVFTLAVLLLLCTSVYKAETTEQPRYAVAFWSISVLLTAALGFSAMFSSDFVNSTVLFMAVACVGALAGAFAVALPLAGAFALTVSISGVLVFAFVGAAEGVVALAMAGAFAVSFAISSRLAICLAVLIMLTALVMLDHINIGEAIIATTIVSAVVTLAFIQKNLGDRFNRPTIALLTFALILLTILFAVIDLIDQFDSSESVNIRACILFLGVLPLLNGFSDYLSIGATRYLLRQAESNNLLRLRALFWLVDGMVGFFALAILALALVVFLTIFVPGDGIGLLSLDQTLVDIKENPANYYWLGCVLFSTLLPSVIHLAVLFFSICWYLPVRVRLWIARWIKFGSEGDRVKGRVATIVLTIFCAISIWVPAIALIRIGHFVWENSNYLLTFGVDNAAALHSMLKDFA